MAIYCWGSSTHGELGLGGIDDENIPSPQAMNWINTVELNAAACGATHTLLLTNSGKVFSCGNNDYGQLGQDISRKRPQLISALDNYAITQVACGVRHSLAINEWGQLFTWGSNEQCQLGQDTQGVQSTPKLVKSLATKHIVQIASGKYHSLALLNNGELYSWGLNTNGQLGLGMTCEKVMKPTLIKSLAGIPIAFICCGGNHCFVVSKSGAVFGFGNNTSGQLGINEQQSKVFPTQLKTLRSINVRFIACGDDFSVFLTQDGGVFTCGAGNFGQLGHGNTGNEILPRMVMELMGSTITQVTCGSHHTLALVPSRGRIYGFGIGGSGQLGNRTNTNSTIPQVVIGPWVSPSGVAILDRDTKSKMDGQDGMVSSGLEPLMMVSKIFSGGDHCIVAADQSELLKIPADYRLYDQRSQILYLTVELAKCCSEIGKDSNVDLELLSTIEVIFKSVACMNASFLRSNDAHYCCTSKNNGVDVEAAAAAFEWIRKIENESIKQIIWDSITIDLIPSLSDTPADVETLRIYLTIPLYHEFINSKNYAKLHSVFGEKLLRLGKIPLKIITGWWTLQSLDYYERLVENFKGVVSFIIHGQVTRIVSPTGDKQMARYDRHLVCALNLLLMLFRINHQERKQKVPYEFFHLPELTELVDVRQDYIQWLFDTNPDNFHLCSYPFLFDASAKMMILQTDQAVQMHNAMQNATANSFMMAISGFVGGAQQYIVLNVTRENIVDDTIRELASYTPSDLKKPLKIKFHGEEAEDAGGVKKEFFMLLLRDILDPKYGMFKSYEDSRSIWFSENSFEGEEMYTLIGILCGLAIYNFTIINLPFPITLYKKLLKEEVDNTDLRDLSPMLANSMQSILDYTGDDFEEVFDLTFEITRESFGETKNVPLKVGGANTRLTQENKEEFVNLYIDFVFNKSVERYFNGFRNGFMRVCGSRVLELFKPHELMAVVIGNEEYDWHVLESETEYKNGYSSGDQTIQWFWEVFHDLSLEDKKSFLLFLTGSDRIPIQGMKAIKILIQPTTDNKFLPVAHTCFNLLDLPRYQTKEKLKYKLTQAIQQTQGFSLV